MNWIDYVLLVVMAVSAGIGLFRGLVREALSLLVWALAIWAAWTFGARAAGLFEPLLADPVFRIWAARIAIFVAVLICGGLLGWLIAFVLDRSGLTGTDRVLGGLFGLARGALMTGLLIIGLELADFDRAAWWRESKLIPYAAPIADKLRVVAAHGVGQLDEVIAPE